jgi:hypothetical protein
LKIRSILLPILLLGCASAAPPADAPATTRPADTVSLDQAKPLATFETDGQETAFTDKLRPPLASQTLYFGEVDSFDGPDSADPSATVPVIAVKDDDGFKAVAVPLKSAANTAWKYVAAGPAAGSIWGCLDTATGESGKSVIVAHSTDGGATFSFMTFKKPCKMAVFYDFGMTRDGHGRVTIALDTDCGKHKAGLYHYETTDAGVTWPAEPRFEPDAMIHSETVPEDEQPDADEGKKTTKTLWAGHRS